jgi:hypothetical protein
MADAARAAAYKEAEVELARMDRQDDWVYVLSALGLFTLHEAADRRGCGGLIVPCNHPSECCRSLISALVIFMVSDRPCMSSELTSLYISMEMRMLFRFTMLVVAFALIMQFDPSHAAETRATPTACVQLCDAAFYKCLRRCNPSGIGYPERC